MEQNSSRYDFLALLRGGLWNTPLTGISITGEARWNSVFQVAVSQSVWGLVADAVNRMDADSQPPLETLRRLNYMLSRNRLTHARLNDTLVKAVAMFNQGGVHPILLKGQGVATYYHDSTLRQCGDIDLYIGMADYRKACLLAKTWGEDEERTESEKHYHFAHNGVSVELHRIAEVLPNSRQDKLFQRWTNGMLTPEKCRTLLFGDTKVMVPPSDFEVLYIFNHAYHHFLSGGVGLRQLCDWGLALHTFKDGIDREALEKRLKDFGLWRGWQIFGCIAVDVLGLPQRELPFYNPAYRKDAGKVMELIFQSGNFGFHDPSRTKRPNGYVAGKWHTFRWTHRRFYRLFPIFPTEIAAAWSRYISKGLRQIIKDKAENKTAQ